MEQIITTSTPGKILLIRKANISGVSVTYTLFENAEPSSSQFIYSIRLDTVSDHGTESVIACDICRNRSKAEDLFCLLADGTVTSCTLFEILEDNL